MEFGICGIERGAGLEYGGMLASDNLMAASAFSIFHVPFIISYVINLTCVPFFFLSFHLFLLPIYSSNSISPCWFHELYAVLRFNVTKPNNVI